MFIDDILDLQYVINCFKSLTHKRFRRPSKMFTAVVSRPLPEPPCTRPTFTGTGRTCGSKGRSLYPKGRRRRWLHRKPLRPFGYRLLNEAATGTAFATWGLISWVSIGLKAGAATGLEKSEKRGVQAARNGPSEDRKCW